MPKPKSSNEGSGGKLVDTWIYEFPAVVVHGADDDDDAPRRQTVAAKKIAVELRIIKKFAASTTPPLATKEVWFRVSSQEAKFALEGTDIEALRAALWEKLDAKYKTLWEDYYLVEIRRGYGPYEGRGTSLEFNYRRVEKGIAWDGTLLLREHRYTNREHIDPWPGDFRDKQDKVIACIPATKQNTEALEKFEKQIDGLRDRLADLLRPDKILNTLMAAQHSNLLGAPKEENLPDEPTAA